MKFYCQNTDAGLIPLYPSDLDEKKKLKKDKVYACEIKFERNYKLLSKFMALVKLGCENSKTVDMPFDSYRRYITIKAGFYETYKTAKGIFIDAKSISFGNMKEEDFQEVYNRVLDKIIIDTEADREKIEKELLGFM